MFGKVSSMFLGYLIGGCNNSHLKACIKQKIMLKHDHDLCNPVHGIRFVLHISLFSLL